MHCAGDFLSQHHLKDILPPPAKVILAFGIYSAAKQTFSCPVTSHVVLIALICDLLTSCSWCSRALGKRPSILQHVHVKGCTKAQPFSFQLKSTTTVELEVPSLCSSTPGMSCRGAKAWLLHSNDEPVRNNSIDASISPSVSDRLSSDFNGTMNPALGGYYLPIGSCLCKCLNTPSWVIWKFSSNQLIYVI